MSKAVGIDLGTVNSCVGVFENGNVEIITYEGRRITPSIVGFNGNRRTVGDSAKIQQSTYPTNTIYSKSFLFICVPKPKV